MSDCPVCGDAMYDSFDTSEDLWGNQCSYRVTVCPTCGWFSNGRVNGGDPYPLVLSPVGAHPMIGGVVTGERFREASVDLRFSPSFGDLPCPPDPYQRPEDQYVIPEDGFESSKNDEVSS